MADLEDRGRKPEEKLGEGVASEVGCPAAKRFSSSLRLLSVVGTLVLTAICSAGTPVAARGRDATLPGDGLPGDIYWEEPDTVTVGGMPQPVAQVSVPAGNYVVHVSMHVANTSFGLTAVLQCNVLGGFSGAFPMFVPPMSALGPEPTVTLSFTDVAVIRSAGPIPVFCQSDPTVNVIAWITAIRGGTFHYQYRQ